MNLSLGALRLEATFKFRVREPQGLNASIDGLTKRTSGTQSLSFYSS